MELVLPLILLVLGLVIGFAGARMLLRSKEEQALNAARLETQAEVATLRNELAVLTSKLQSSDSRLSELHQELIIRTNKLDQLTKDFNSETTRRSSLETEVKQIPELKQILTERERELSQIRESLQIEIDNRSAAEARAKRVPDLEKMLLAADSQIKESESRIAHLQTSLQKERQATEEKLQLLNEAQQKMSDAFSALSSRALQSNNQSFLELAKTTLEKFQEAAKGDLEKRQQNITEIVRPVRESLEKVDQKIQELEKAREGAYSSITEQVKMLRESQATLRQETSNLVKALRAPQTRGRWGEIQLRRVVEMAGMLEYCDFYEQKSDESSYGAIRPDMEIRLPGDKAIIVDAKVPLQAYLEAIESSDDEEKKQKTRDHARQVRAHVQTLSSKKYWDTLKHTPEFVILFLSGESLLYAALEADPSLIEYGIGEKVIIATPTTLIALLKSASYGWRQESLAKNAKAISELGSDLYRRIAVVADHLAKLGGNLDKSVRSYNDVIGSLERNVLPGARKFKDLAVSTGDKDIPELPQVEIATRNVQAPELVAAGTDKAPKLKAPSVTLFE